jgi:hypothetical protein
MTTLRPFSRVARRTPEGLVTGVTAGRAVVDGVAAALVGAPAVVCARAAKDRSAAPRNAPAQKARRAVISRGMVFRSAWWAVSMKAN